MTKTNNKPAESGTDLKSTSIRLLAAASSSLESATQTFIADSSDPETVHRMRLEIRKIRSVLFLLKKVTVADSYQAISDRLKRLNHALADIRDRDILIANCREMANSSELTNRVVTERTRRAERLRKQLASKEKDGRFLSADWPKSIQWKEQDVTGVAAASYVKERLNSRLTKYLKAGKKVDFDVPDEAHQFRIAGKKIKNVMELYLSEKDQGSRKLVESLSKLLRAIGSAHDMTASRRILQKMSSDDPKLHNENVQAVRHIKQLEKKKSGHLHHRWLRVRKKIKHCM